MTSLASFSFIGSIYEFLCLHLLGPQRTLEDVELFRGDSGDALVQDGRGSYSRHWEAPPRRLLAPRN